MRSFFSCIVCLLFIGSAFGQKSDPKVSMPDPNKKIQIVETACGECQFKLSGKGCDLAVRIDGKSYFVDGTEIDSHGDAHAKDGFCNAVRKAEVQGEIINDRFKVTYFKVLKNAEKKELPTTQKN
jgi:Family of unknown function (DUF6370)